MGVMVDPGLLNDWGECSLKRFFSGTLDLIKIFKKNVSNNIKFILFYGEKSN